MNKSNPVAVVGIQIGVNLKNKSRKIFVKGLHIPLICLSVLWFRCNADKGIEQLLHAKVVDRRTKKYRCQIAFFV